MTYSNSILELKRKALAMGLCGDYKGRLDKSTTTKDVMDIALDINGVDFLCSSIASGWGLSEDFIRRNFAEYINGNYVATVGKSEPYTSEMYVGHTGEIVARTTLLVVLYSDAVIHVPINHACKIFSAGNTRVDIECDGFCEFADYTTQYDVKQDICGHITFIDPHKDSSSWINFSINGKD